jgi:predicted nucleic acid-binding protein
VILADTSVWVDHLRRSDTTLAMLLNNQQVLTHPFVIGELALGYLPQRPRILRGLHNLRNVNVATDAEVLAFIDREELIGLGIGYVDAHLLAAIRLTPSVLLWTRDKRLLEVANKLGIGIDPTR